jgi:hypothetical protein
VGEVDRGRRALTLTLALAASVAACKDPPPPAHADAAPAASSATLEAAAPAPPQNNNPYTAAQIQKVTNPTGLAPYAGPTGSVEGTITVRGGEPPRVEADFSRCPDGAAAYGTQYRVGAPGAEADTHELGDAIVAITGYDGFVAPKTDYVSVSFDGCAYDRRTVLLTYGQRIEVLNRSKKQLITPDIDGVPVLSLRIAAPQSIAPVKLYPPGVGRFRLIDRGVLKYIREDVYVLLQPLHSASDLKGHYRIDGIPVGKATVNVGHPAFSGDAAKEVQIEANVVLRVDLTLAAPGADAGAAQSKPGGPKKVTPAPIR